MCLFVVCGCSVSSAHTITRGKHMCVRTVADDGSDYEDRDNAVPQK